MVGLFQSLWLTIFWQTAVPYLGLSVQSDPSQPPSVTEQGCGRSSPPSISIAPTTLWSKFTSLRQSSQIWFSPLARQFKRRQNISDRSNL